jgi:hypothetical protein
VEVISSTATISRSASWNGRDEIIFASGGINLVKANGGEVRRVLTPDRSKGEFGYVYPQFLPDGRRYIFFHRNLDTSKNGIYVARVDSSEKKLLVSSETNAAYVAGYLLYVPRGESGLMAQPLDVEKLELSGVATRVADQVGVNSLAWDIFHTAFSASPTILAFHSTSVATANWSGSIEPAS